MNRFDEERAAELARRYARASRLNRDEDGYPDGDYIVDSCGWCEEDKPVGKRLTDKEALCADCLVKLDRETRPFPNCPECGHRYYVVALSQCSNNVRSIYAWGYKCSGCGLKFTDEAAAQAADRRKEEKPPTRVLFAPTSPAPIIRISSERRDARRRKDGIA